MSNQGPIVTGNYLVDLEHDPKIGYILTVKREIDGQTYVVRTIISEYTYVGYPQALKEALDQARYALDREIKRKEIKEFNNPSFRRKDYVKQNQVASST